MDSVSFDIRTTMRGSTASKCCTDKERHLAHTKSTVRKGTETRQRLRVLIIKTSSPGIRRCLLKTGSSSTTLLLLFSVIGLTETWLKSYITPTQVNIPDYNVYRANRSVRTFNDSVFQIVKLVVLMIQQRWRVVAFPIQVSVQWPFISTLPRVFECTRHQNVRTHHVIARDAWWMCPW